MGQQQLLLLVLGIVIVGIAVVAGIQAFSEGKQKAEQDAAVSDAMRIISDLQAWYLKPTAFGGGGEKESNWTNASFGSIGLYPAKGRGRDEGFDAAKYETLNGCYTLTPSATGVAIAIEKRTSEDCDGAIATATVKSRQPDERRHVGLRRCQRVSTTKRARKRAPDP